MYVCIYIYVYVYVYYIYVKSLINACQTLVQCMAARNKRIVHEQILVQQNLAMKDLHQKNIHCVLDSVPFH